MKLILCIYEISSTKRKPVPEREAEGGSEGKREKEGGRDIASERERRGGEQGGERKRDEHRAHLYQCITTSPAVERWLHLFRSARHEQQGEKKEKKVGEGVAKNDGSSERDRSR